MATARPLNRAFQTLHLKRSTTLRRGLPTGHAQHPGHLPGIHHPRAGTIRCQPISPRKCIFLVMSTHLCGKLRCQKMRENSFPQIKDEGCIPPLLINQVRCTLNILGIFPESTTLERVSFPGNFTTHMTNFTTQMTNFTTQMTNITTQMLLTCNQ